MTVRRYTISPLSRIRSSQDFQRIYDLNQRAGDDHLLLFAAPNDLGRPRFGLSVSRKHGGAVVRNRLKRLLREAWRLSQHDLPPDFDLILIPRRYSGATLEHFRRSLPRLARRISRRIQSQTRP